MKILYNKLFRISLILSNDLKITCNLTEVKKCMLIQNVLMITENSSKHHLNVRACTHFIDLSLKLKQVQHETVDYDIIFLYRCCLTIPYIP